MPDAHPLLKISAIGKQFPGVRALHDVDLTLNQGEVLSKILSKIKKPVIEGGALTPGGNLPPMGNHPSTTAKMI